MKFLATLLLTAISLSANGQGFIDLDFETATLNPTPIPNSLQGFVPAASGLPGWTVYLGNTQQSQVLQNAFYNSTAVVDILGPNWGSGILGVGVIDGNYSVLIQPGASAQGNESASIEQIGMIPANAESLQFKAWGIGGGDFSVSFGGISLSPAYLSTEQAPSGEYYNLYSASVAPFAGETGLLEFAANGQTSLLLDDITFTAVPEPNALLLSALGCFGFLARRQFTRTRTPKQLTK